MQESGVLLDAEATAGPPSQEGVADWLKSRMEHLGLAVNADEQESTKVRRAGIFDNTFCRIESKAEACQIENLPSNPRGSTAARLQPFKPTCHCFWGKSLR